MILGSIRDRYLEILDRIRELAAQANRPPPTLVVVTKNRDPSEIREVYEAGARDFGENRAQEYEAHRQDLADLPGIRWHFIGHLQTNKVGKVVGPTELVHSVDSIKLLHALDARARSQSLPKVQVLLQVNCSNEASKSGFAPEEVAALPDEISKLEYVSVQGLMTMAPLEGGPKAASQSFHTLKGLHQGLRNRAPTQYTGDQLSMGMSQDYPQAIEAGATLIRIGSKIFEGAPA